MRGRVQKPALLLPGCVTLGKSLHLSDPELHHALNGDTDVYLSEAW